MARIRAGQVLVNNRKFEQMRTTLIGLQIRCTTMMLLHKLIRRYDELGGYTATLIKLDLGMMLDKAKRFTIEELKDAVATVRLAAKRCEEFKEDLDRLDEAIRRIKAYGSMDNPNIPADYRRIDNLIRSHDLDGASEAIHKAVDRYEDWRD